MGSRTRVRTSGPHVIRTEVETLDEALNLLQARGAYHKKPKRGPRTLRQIFADANFSSRRKVREKKPKVLPPSGYWPRDFHIQCGRCGLSREKAIEGQCGLINRCLGKFLTHQ